MKHKLYFYTKNNCLLCDEARAILSLFQSDYNFEIIEQDINEDPVLLERYFLEIPVIKIDNEVVNAKNFNYETVEKFLNKHFSR